MIFALNIKIQEDYIKIIKEGKKPEIKTVGIVENTTCANNCDC